MHSVFAVLLAISLTGSPTVSVGSQTLTAAVTDGAGTFDEQDLVGTFASKGCENVVMTADGKVAHLRRYYNWDLTSYATTYTFYSDTRCSAPTYTFFFSGPYRLGKPRPELGRVREVEVIFGTVMMTADSAAGAAMLDAAGCGTKPWTAGEVRDVSDDRCLIKEPRGTCIGDSELLMVDGDRLAPGVRSANMCTSAGRPTKIQADADIRRIRRAAGAAR